MPSIIGNGHRSRPKGGGGGIGRVVEGDGYAQGIGSQIARDVRVVCSTRVSPRPHRFAGSDRHVGAPKPPVDGKITRAKIEGAAWIGDLDVIVCAIKE
jgi:hypothetical protein